MSVAVASQVMQITTFTLAFQPFTTFLLLHKFGKEKLQVVYGCQAALTAVKHKKMTFTSLVIKDELTDRHLLILNNFTKYTTWKATHCKTANAMDFF